MGAATLGLVYTVVSAASAGWASARTLGSFAVIAALVAAFVAIEQRTAHPLVRLGILRSAALRRANVGAMALFGSWAGFQIMGTLYLQQVRGWSALTMALAFLPVGAIVAFGAPRIGPLVDRFGTGRLIAGGLASMVVAYALFLRVGAHSGYAAAMLPTMLLGGVGFALAFGPLNMAATNGVADHEQGLASGLVQTSFQIGGAVVLAIVTAVMTAAAQHGHATAGSSTALLDGLRPGLVVTLAAVGLGLVTVLGGAVRRRAPAPAPVAATCAGGD
jgi:Na+/melibiose symporter-like transporter